VQESPGEIQRRWQAIVNSQEIFMLARENAAYSATRRKGGDEKGNGLQGVHMEDGTRP